MIFSGSGRRPASRLPFPPVLSERHTLLACHPSDTTLLACAAALIQGIHPVGVCRRHQSDARQQSVAPRQGHARHTPTASPPRAGLTGKSAGPATRGRRRSQVYDATPRDRPSAAGATERQAPAFGRPAAGGRRIQRSRPAGRQRRDGNAAGRPLADCRGGKPAGFRFLGRFLGLKAVDFRPGGGEWRAGSRRAWSHRAMAAMKADRHLSAGGRRLDIRSAMFRSSGTAGPRLFGSLRLPTAHEVSDCCLSSVFPHLACEQDFILLFWLLALALMLFFPPSLRLRDGQNRVMSCACIIKWLISES